MSRLIATARAGSNIALIKYWGKRDPSINLPLNDSISMTLSDAHTTTTVEWDESLDGDEFYLDGERVCDERATRVSRHLDRIRSAWYRIGARVASKSNFPASTGIASSASAFAALSTAAIAAFGEGLPDSAELSRWARKGSGSACRSIDGGFVHWKSGTCDEDSFAHPLASAEHWDLHDLVVLVTGQPKEIPSTEGHRIAANHPFMATRQAHLPERLISCQAAIAKRDFETLALLVETEALEVQGIMMSGTPSCLYPVGLTMDFLHAIRAWRRAGIPVCFTLDAGPNVHVLCEADAVETVLDHIRAMAPGTDVLVNRPGDGVSLLGVHLL